MARHCGRCGKTGHYTPTCTRKAAAKKKQGRVAKKIIKRRQFSSGTVTSSRQGLAPIGIGKGWLVMYHGGRTGATQHDKTWAIKIVKKNGKCIILTRHGRRTGQKNESSRPLQSCVSAISRAQALVRSKLRKGYTIVGSNKR